MPDNDITALFSPAIHNPEQRQRVTLPHGKSIAEIVASFCPQIDLADLQRLRVHMVTDRGCWPVEQSMWHCVFPKPGVTITIRCIPGKGELRSILSIVVSVAAFALAGPIGTAMAGTFGWTAATWSGIAMGGLPMVGAVQRDPLTFRRSAEPVKASGMPMLPRS